MFCGWEGNRRSGVALVMRHRLSGLSTYRLKGQCAVDEHPPTLHWVRSPLYLFYKQLLNASVAFYLHDALYSTAYA